MAASVQIRPLQVDGAFEFTPPAFPDERGLFVSPFQRAAFEEATGRAYLPVAQTNHSRSRRGAVRGVHFTLTPPGSAKYVYCPKGRALDIMIDIRVGSPTFGKWDAVLLDPQDFRAVYFPVGVGHAFCALEDDTVMSYLLTEPYVATDELALDVFDPALGLPVPKDLEVVQSERDRGAPTLAECQARGVLPEYHKCHEVEDSLWR